MIDLKMVIVIDLIIHGETTIKIMKERWKEEEEEKN